MIVEIGDLHIREEQPFKNAFLRFSAWLEKRYSQKDVTYVLTGDLFNSEKATVPEVEMALDFVCNTLKGKAVILRGNHDYKKSGSALDVFKPFRHVKVIEQPTVMGVEDMTYLFLPYLWKDVDSDWRSMKEYEVGGKLESFLTTQKDFNRVMGHFSNVPLFDTEINIDWIKKPKVMGHIHKYGRNDFIGVPYITRYDERGMTCRIFEVSSTEVKEVVVPEILRYETVEYGVMPTTGDYELLIDVKNAPSFMSAEEKYEEYHIHRIYTVFGRDITKQNGQNVTTRLPITTYLDGFIRENKIEGLQKEKLTELITE